MLNKQPPNKQIWLSSPIRYVQTSDFGTDLMKYTSNSGPKRYDYDVSKASWFYNRDQKTLGALLRNEVARILGREPENINLPIL